MGGKVIAIVPTNSTGDSQMPYRGRRAEKCIKASTMATAKVLVVEDNRDARGLIVLVLRRAGYEVVEAEDGTEALRQAIAQHPDLILLDLGLPGMNGDEVTARIREDPSIAQTRIVVITAFDSAAPIVRRAIAAGADELICKPTDFKSLLEVIRRAIGQAQIRAVA